MAEEEKKKAKKGDIRPVYQQVGIEVCVQSADKPENEQWVQAPDVETAQNLSKQLKKSKE